jgi:pimeloyl-ACP methyl ester carboxylesterase
MDSVAVDGVQVAYKVRGEGSPVVLVSGFSADHSYWSPIRQALLQHRRVLVLDNRGVGASDDPSEPYTAATMAADVLAVCDHVGFETFDLVGQSMGTSISIELAAMAPDRVDRLALLNGYVRLRAVGLAVIDYAMQRMRAGASWREVVQILTPWCLCDQMLESPGSLEAILADAEANPNPPSLNALELHTRILHEFDAAGLLASVGARTLCLGAHHDVIALPAGAAQLAAGIEGAHLELVDGGHDVPAENPGLIADVLGRFLVAN